MSTTLPSAAVCHLGCASTKTHQRTRWLPVRWRPTPTLTELPVSKICHLDPLPSGGSADCHILCEGVFPLLLLAVMVFVVFEKVFGNSDFSQKALLHDSPVEIICCVWDQGLPHKP